jgi:hypothetical protein
VASDSGYSKLPTADPAALAVWFQRGADQGRLPKDFEGFPHTIAVLQTEEAPDPPRDLPQQAPSRHRIPKNCSVVAKPILDGLHHECGLERSAA